jgi:peptidoglycan/xylan/chitin deacetylase (PgdA/CDA1 family)
MRVLMYHYVRPEPQDMPFFRYLHYDDFSRQLDSLQQVGKIVSAAEAISSFKHNNVGELDYALTFDDGLKEHLHCVAPILEAKGLTGFFFVSTDPITRSATLDVHRVHHLLGSFGGKIVWETLTKLTSIDQRPDRQTEWISAVTYNNQSNDAHTTLFKRYINYLATGQQRTQLLDTLETDLGADTRWKQNFYLGLEDIAELRARGHIVGSHAASHQVLASLSADEQRDELAESFQVLQLDQQDPDHRLFCYPYGGKASFTAQTIASLEDVGYTRAFAVDAQALTQDHLINTPLTLPRFDCNMFPFGKASMGRERPYSS